MTGLDVENALVFRAASALDRFWRIVVIVAVAFMAVAVLWQIGARYLPLPASSALVELVQYAFSIATFAGAAILFRKREHLAIGFVLNAMPARVKTVLFWISDLATIAILGLLAYLSIDFIDSGMARYSPVLNIRVGWVYLVVSLALASSLLFAIEARLRGDGVVSAEVSRNSSGKDLV